MLQLSQLTIPMKRFISFLVLGAALLLPLVSGTPVKAQGFDGFGSFTGEIAREGGLGSADLETVVGSGIRIFLSILGIIFLIMILYAGFLWMTAGGEEGKVEQAQTLMKNAVIGLVIILASYAITTFVVEAISEAGIDTGSSQTNGT